MCYNIPQILKLRNKNMEITPIAHIENEFTDRFAIPRQSGIASNILSKIVFEKEFQDKNAIKGIDGFSHLWIIWGFSKSIREEYSLTVRPPRLGGNERVGVFASRSPFRPNSLGLSSVRLIGIEEGNALIVSGADILNGTPIYDIKPYIKFTDSHEDAVCGYVDKREFKIVNVIDNGLLNGIRQAESIKEILSNDPRPAYQEDENRIYGFRFAGYEIKFKVKENDLFVISIDDERE